MATSTSKRPLLVGGALLLVTVLAFLVTSGLSLVRGPVEDKLRSKLESKFRQVDFGCFELQQDSLKLCDVALEEPAFSLKLKQVLVKFEVDWGWSPQVILTEVSGRKGSLEGSLEKLLEFKDSQTDSSSAGTSVRSSTVQLDQALLKLGEMDLNLQYGDFNIQTELSARATGKEPVNLELRQLQVTSAKTGLLSSAATLRTTLDWTAPFPLQLIATDAEARFETLVLTEIQGLIELKDQNLQGIGVNLTGQTDVGQSWKLEGEVDRIARTVDVALSAEDLRPFQLPGAQHLPLDPQKGRVSGLLALKGSMTDVAIDAWVHVQGLHVEHDKLTQDSVILNNEIELKGRADLDARKFVLKEGYVRPLKGRGSWELQLSGQVHHAEAVEQRRYEVLAVLGDPIPCQELLEAVPPGLIPALRGFRLSGNTSVHLNVVMDMDDPEATVLEGSLGLDECGIEKVPQTVANLARPFVHVVRMSTGRVLSRFIGPGEAMYTPYDRIPVSVSAAVLSTEDGGFWRHDGFIKSQFEASLKRNIELGVLRRGGSTITMQLVKNLLLTQEKTISRKLQELFLTWVLEERLEKARIMELYLNIVELGPGIYGVTEAADHYFNKTPLELTTLEAAFIATLLPKPIERHGMWCRGELTESHEKYVRMVHRRMLARGRKHPGTGISQEEFEEAEATPWEFSRLGWPGDVKTCLNQDRMAQGPYTQGALSGLLLGRSE